MSSLSRKQKGKLKQKQRRQREALAMLAFGRDPIQESLDEMAQGVGLSKSEMATVELVSHLPADAFLKAHQTGSFEMPRGKMNQVDPEYLMDLYRRIRATKFLLGAYRNSLSDSTTTSGGTPPTSQSAGPPKP